jgi:hypothetical protein
VEQVTEVVDVKLSFLAPQESEARLFPTASLLGKWVIESYSDYYEQLEDRQGTVRATEPSPPWKLKNRRRVPTTLRNLR